MKKLGLFVFFFCGVFTIMVAQEEDSSIKYIEDYYSHFSTGYNFNGRYTALTDNYKASLNDSIFKLTFDSFDEFGKAKNQVITINLNEVIRLESGVNVVEVHHFDTIILPISFQLIFYLADESYVIDINFNSEEKVEESEIYKAFDKLLPKS